MFPALVLAAILAVPTVPAPVTPHFVSAQQWTEAAYAGYTARVQVRATNVPVFVWVGGYLTDGTFVQSGLSLGVAPQVFAWATQNSYGNVNDPSANPVPLSWHPLTAAAGSWVGVTLARSGCRWSFSYTDEAGSSHPIGSFDDCDSLRALQANTEYWSDRAANFGVTALRGLRALSGAGAWVVPPEMFWSAVDCGYERVSSTTPGNIVFRGADGSATETWARLW